MHILSKRIFYFVNDFASLVLFSSDGPLDNYDLGRTSMFETLTLLSHCFVSLDAQQFLIN